MAARSKSILAGCGLSIAALMAMALSPLSTSSAPQESVTPLKDVCPAGWTRHRCRLVRLCVSPEVEAQYDVAKALQYKGGCGGPDDSIVPEAWTHATPYELGWLAAGGYPGYNFCSRVAKLDSPNIKNGDLDGAIERLHLLDGSESYQNGFHDWLNDSISSLDKYGLKPPTAKGVEVCPSGWVRFSCQFVRLCVVPRVANTHDLESSEAFQAANCRDDNRIVPEEATHATPFDVGVAAGALLVVPKYFRAVKLNSTDIVNDDVDEAIKRLVLVPLPTHSLIDYTHGTEKGYDMFKGYLASAKRKARDSETPKDPK